MHRSIYEHVEHMNQLAEDYKSELVDLTHEKLASHGDVEDATRVEDSNTLHVTFKGNQYFITVVRA